MKTPFSALRGPRSTTASLSLVVTVVGAIVTCGAIVLADTTQSRLLAQRDALTINIAQAQRLHDAYPALASTRNRAATALAPYCQAAADPVGTRLATILLLSRDARVAIGSVTPVNVSTLQAPVHASASTDATAIAPPAPTILTQQAISVPINGSYGDVMDSLNLLAASPLPLRVRVQRIDRSTDVSSQRPAVTATVIVTFIAPTKDVCSKIGVLKT